MRSRLALLLIFVALLALAFWLLPRDRTGPGAPTDPLPSTDAQNGEPPAATPEVSAPAEPPALVESPRGRLLVRACREFEDDLRLSGASVEVRCADGTRLSGRTNDGGELRLSDVPVGIVRTTVSADGFFPNRREYDRVPEGGLKVITARLLEARTLAGRVIYAAEGAPVPDAMVRAFTTEDCRFSDGGHWSATGPAGESTTGPDGRFALTGAPGHIDTGLLIYVEARGFRTTRRLLQKLPEMDGEILVSLTAGGRVVGRVRRPDGQALGAVRVTATPVDQLTRVGINRMGLAGELDGTRELIFPIHTLTDEQGDYELVGLGLGDRYCVRFEKAGFAVRTERDVRVSSTRPVTDLSVSLGPGGTLPVTVTDAAGRPIQGAEVTATHPGSLDSVSAVTGEKGVARLSPVPPGTRTIHASAPGGSRVSRSFVMPESADAACSLVLIRGDPNWRPRPARGCGRESLTGTVAFSDGGPVSWGTVCIVALNRQTDIAPDGTFRLNRLPAGVHAVEVKPFHAKNVNVRATVPGPPLQLVVRRYPELRGTVAVPPGAPPPESFTVRTGTGSSFWKPWEPADARRVTFAFSADPGPMKLEIEATGYTGCTWTGTVPETGSADAGELVLDPGRVLAGQIVDREGKPVPHAKVGLWRTTPAGADGRFRIPGFSRSRSVVLVDAPGFLPARVEVPEDVGELRVVLDRGIVVAVDVRDPAGDPVSRARVSILEVGAPRRRPLSESRQTPTTGSVEFRTPPGEYELTAIRPGDSREDRVHRKITVDPKGEREPVVLVLP